MRYRHLREWPTNYKGGIIIKPQRVGGIIRYIYLREWPTKGGVISLKEWEV